MQTLLSSLEEVMGSTFSDKQKERFWNQMGIVLKAHVSTILFSFQLQSNKVLDYSKYLSSGVLMITINTKFP